ncbi:MAG TPA: aminotransferase class I/II-fold pyridoxal phosphate-dependent enzyme, partial [Chryseolinea sp.]|nr:aminotransferase class I/II-fold pyridoxal phosphate-dependent enzyme [Chryseolinea sp.]
MKNNLDRRNFITTLSVAGVGVAMGIPKVGSAAAPGKPALLGGPKAHPSSFPGWPMFDQTEENGLLSVLKSKDWGRLGGTVVSKFEKEYAAMTGAKHTLGVSSGTAALLTMMGALDLGPGDEVIMPVYTFIATYNAVVLNYALPILIDTDLESFQIDANKIEAAINPQTKVIMPVHIGGSPVDLDKIMEITNKNRITLIEDACQAHLAEWKGKKVGTYGLGGAFSFQASKNLNCGEGGAIITNDENFATTC